MAVLAYNAEMTQSRTKLFIFLLCLLVILALSCNTLTVDPTSTLLPADTQAPIPTQALDTNQPPQATQTALSSTGGFEETQLLATTALPPTPADNQAPEQAFQVRFAVIGDYGSGDNHERAVTELVKSWAPDFIITVGDNNYPDGSTKTIDQNIGQFYHEYIYPYTGSYGQGADRLRFFPTLGNHDWNARGAAPYLDYFTLPGNERYYDFSWGPVHFFAIDADSREPDGVSRKSIQAQWLKEQLASSSLPWKVVFFHQPPFSSGYHGSVDWMRWPFQEWGASVVLSGHDHTYERLLINGFPYFVNGVGGGAIYSFGQILDGSQVRYNDDYGAMLVIADESQMTFQFFNIGGQLIDSYQILAQ
jgi:tartrate-resistant acid phosphatase type 5